jgi:hypothetical protein
MVKVRIARGIAIAGLALFLPALIGDGAGQTVATGRLMREKLTHAQRLLEALTTSDYALLERESEALTRIPSMQGWMVLQSPEYRRYSEAFLRATGDLNTAARARDLDEAMMHFQTLTASCYQCHRYLKSRRLAK